MSSEVVFVILCNKCQLLKQLVHFGTTLLSRVTKGCFCSLTNLMTVSLTESEIGKCDTVSFSANDFVTSTVRTNDFLQYH